VRESERERATENRGQQERERNLLAQRNREDEEKCTRKK